MGLATKRDHSTPPLAGIFGIEAGVQSKGGKMGAEGLEPKAELVRHLTDVYPGEQESRP